MVLYGLVEILKLKSKPLMNGRGYGVRNGRGYGVMWHCAQNRVWHCHGMVWYSLVWFGRNSEAEVKTINEWKRLCSREWKRLYGVMWHCAQNSQ